MSAVTFDTLKFVERLEAGGFSTQQARAAAEAFADATGQELATKADVSIAKNEMLLELRRVESAIELAKRDITIRLGGMMVVGFGVLLAALRFMLHG